MAWSDMAAAAQEAAKATFSESVTYEPEGLAELTVLAIYSSVHHEVDLELNVSVNTENPLVALRAVDLPADPTETDHVRVGLPRYSPERRYRVKRKESDGQGWWLLYLVRAAPLSP